MKITLTSDAGTKTFTVERIEFQTATGQLELICRDGRVCLGLVGAWDVSIAPTRALSMGCDEVERIHEGRQLVTIN